MRKSSSKTTASACPLMNAKSTISMWGETGGWTRGPVRRPAGRPCLGRKGLGKFAGFGIADLVEIATVSQNTGERTTFRLDLNQLRSSEFVSTQGKEIEVLEATPPDPAAKSQHGTIVRLRSLKLSQRRTADALARQMARRFLQAQQTSPFTVLINGIELPKDETAGSIQFEDFPETIVPKSFPKA